MTQSLEAVNAYDKAQSEVKRRKKKQQIFVDNIVWNEIVRDMFLGGHVINLAIKHGVSDKTIYKWRRDIIDEVVSDRYRLTNATIEILKGCKIMFRDNGSMKLWSPDQSYLERLKDLNRKEEQLTLSPIIEDKTPKEQCMPIENFVNNRLQQAQDHSLAETSTLLQAPSGDRLITDVNNPQLMMFLKAQGFTLYKISLDKI